MNQKLINLLFIGCIVTLLFTIGYFFLKQDIQMFFQPLNKSLSHKYNRSIPPHTDTKLVNSNLSLIERKLNENENSKWITYRNDELGFSFEYPQEYGDFSVDIIPGDRGKIFRGGFQEFSNVWEDNKYFTIGGNTIDFVADRSIFFLDFIYYSKDSDKFFDYKATGKKYQLDPAKTMFIDGQKAIIVDSKSYHHDRASELLVGPGFNGGALINLPNNNREFKGLAIWNSDINKLSQKKFEEIVSTFKFNR